MSAAPKPWATSPAASSPSGSKHRPRPGSGPGRPHLRGRPDRHRDRRPVWQHQIPDQRGADPRMVRQPQRQRDRQAGHRPGRAHSRRGLRSPRPAQDANALVDLHCVFPHCTKPAMSCDTDHVVSYPGGQTSSKHRTPVPTPSPRQNPLAWDYTVLDRGTYLWTTPNGIKLIRDHRGTSSFPGEP